MRNTTTSTLIFLHGRELKNAANPLGFYALRSNWPRVPEMVWDVNFMEESSKIL
jgi:hypothetical protein